MKIKYETMKLGAAKLAVIEKANTIIAEYQTLGFTLTLRQLFYQYVSRGFIPNTQREYDKLGNAIADGRLAGLIDWEAIEDRTRFLRKQAHWKGPHDIINVCAQQFRLDRWNRQACYVECFIEKDALIGVIEGVCEELDIPYLACRGYASASEIWRAGHQRFRPKLSGRKPKKCYVLYLGDHDPSGIDMSRDVQARLDLFTGHPGGVEVRRLALNMDQVTQYGPPPNPTKMTDSRSGWYVENFGDECWELDALDPPVIADLIRNAVDGIWDEAVWQETLAEEESAKRGLGWVADNWDNVIAGMPNGQQE